MQISAYSPVAGLKVRTLLAIEIGSVLLLIAMHRFFDLTRDLSDVLGLVLLYAPGTLWIVWEFRQQAIRWRDLLGPVAALRTHWTALGVVPLLLLLSSGTFLLLWNVLSLADPEFVAAMLEHMVPADPISREEILSGWGVVAVVSLCFVVPAIEEIWFRGVILHRWTAKWGMMRAAVLSSVVFGLAHLDPIGGVAFGLIMAVLYASTGSLLVPILCHAFNNLLAIVFGGFRWPGFEVSNLEQLYAARWLGLVYTLLAFGCIVWYMRKWHIALGLRDPYSA